MYGYFNIHLHDEQRLFSIEYLRETGPIYMEKVIDPWSNHHKDNHSQTLTYPCNTCLYEMSTRYKARSSSRYLQRRSKARNIIGTSVIADALISLIYSQWFEHFIPSDYRQYWVQDSPCLERAGHHCLSLSPSIGLPQLVAWNFGRIAPRVNT